MSKDQGILIIKIKCQPEWLYRKNGKGHHDCFHYLSKQAFKKAMNVCVGGRYTVYIFKHFH